jgi:hypothetical protein|tara:strand:- start:397 stop:1146 length:750 start_codon:yes stop_codon:yes gene_type:complete
MKEQIEEVTRWLKDQPIKGCITGSTLLEIFEGADVDLFVYDDKSFTKTLFAMHHNDKFQILDKLEQWKFDQYLEKDDYKFKKFGLITIKFMYNTCVPVNIIFKKNCNDIFSVLSSFDLDIISKGYDIQTKQYLDLSENLPNKTATWNKWNTAYYSEDIWELSRLLRQLERCFKYYRRGYNTDLVIKKYIELLDLLLNYENIFSTEKFTEKIKGTKANVLILKRICAHWLEHHEISDEELSVLETKIKEI